MSGIQRRIATGRAADHLRKRGHEKFRKPPLPDRRRPREKMQTLKMETMMADEIQKKPRRSRADSKESAVKDMLAASRAITPPSGVKLNKDQLVIFHEIIDELPRGEWTAHMIRLAAIMARDVAALGREQEALALEGNVVSAANGSPIRNPRLIAVNTLNASILATRRSLSLHSRAKAGMDNRVLARRRDIQRDNEDSAPEDSDLINKPTLN